MCCERHLKTCSLAFLIVFLNFGAASAQDQLSFHAGDIAGGFASQSFVVVSGVPNNPPTVDEVALATIDGVPSTIECVHLGGVSGQSAGAIGPTGTLVVQGGGQLFTNLLDIGSGTAAQGTLVVREAGSAVRENPYGDTRCAQARSYNVTQVGTHSAGTLLVTQGAELYTLFFNVGNDAGASGSVRISSEPICDPMAEPRDPNCSQLNLVGVAMDGAPGNLGFSASGNVGRHGTGQLAVQRARVLLSLEGDTPFANPPVHAFSVGRFADGVGSVRISDQSKFLVTGSDTDPLDLAWIFVGSGGTGTMDISGGSLFEAQGVNDLFFVARGPGSNGEVHLKDAGSTLTVDGLLGLSRGFDGDPEGGISLLTLDAGTVVNAGEIDAHANSTIFSNGTINTPIFTMGGVFNPGFSPGTATINGNMSVTPTGLVRLEVTPGAADKLLINGDFTCNDCNIEVVVEDGATIDSVASADLIDVTGDSTGQTHIQVTNEAGEVIASFDGVDVPSGKISIDQVQIDIKPESSENTINLGSNGSLSVAILSSDSFDATQVDPASVRLSSAEIRLRGNATYVSTQEDVNSDGLLDLVVQMSTDALDLTSTSETALLTGQTFAGDLFEGSDLVRVVPDKT